MYFSTVFINCVFLNCTVGANGCHTWCCLPELFLSCISKKCILNCISQKCILQLYLSRVYFSIVRLVQMVARAGCHTWCRLGCLPEHTQPPFLIRTLAIFSLVTSRKSNAFQKKMVKCSGFTQMVIQKILLCVPQLERLFVCWSSCSNTVVVFVGWFILFFSFLFMYQFRVRVCEINDWVLFSSQVGAFFSLLFFSCSNAVCV